MNPLESPVEIFWANLGGMRGFFFVRRLIINTVAFLILVFLSTPAVSLIVINLLSLKVFVVSVTAD